MAGAACGGEPRRVSLHVRIAAAGSVGLRRPTAPRPRHRSRARLQPRERYQAAAPSVRWALRRRRRRRRRLADALRRRRRLHGRRLHVWPSPLQRRAAGAGSGLRKPAAARVSALPGGVLNLSLDLHGVHVVDSAPGQGRGVGSAAWHAPRSGRGRAWKARERRVRRPPRSPTARVPGDAIIDTLTASRERRPRRPRRRARDGTATPFPMGP